jgi:predicted nucleotidyltransferase
MYNNTKEFAKDLVLTYEAVLYLSKINGDNGIANKKRQETYKKAISIVKDHDMSLNISEFIINISLTEKPSKLMNELFSKGKVILEKKIPYNGVTIKNGKIIGKNSSEIGSETDIESFKNLSILTGIGIGLGDSSIKELAKMGYNTIEQLKKVYETDKFSTFRKGLQGPLCKYFEGTVRIEKMTRYEATKWKDTIDNIVKCVIKNIVKDSSIIVKHKIAGSYARKQEEIGDIDYVIVVNDNDYLYKIMIEVLDEIVKLTDIGNLPVELDSVSETPSKPSRDNRRYYTGIKIWFKVGFLKTKIEIYGYSNCKFFYPYFARCIQPDLQKKIKICASKLDYKLSPYGLLDKNTDENINSDIIREKIGKDEIATLKDLFKFLDYNLT